MMEKIIHDHAIDQAALGDLYARCIQEKRLEQARHMLDNLQARFPNDAQVQHLTIALCIEEKEFTEAMGRIESLMAQRKPDAALIEAALAVRRHIRPVTTMAAAHTGRATISLCMVVKDEVAGLGACLNSAKVLVDEMIVVDTGSSDRTRDVARIFGARLFDYQWHNDFAAARNYSLKQATGDWVLILDADEIIAAKDHDRVRALVNQTGQTPMAYSIVTRNYTHLVNAIGWHANDGCYAQYETGTGWFPTQKVRLFPRWDAIRFRFPVHERVDAAIRETGTPIVECRIPVHHYGYLNEVKKQEKAHRYLQMGYAKLEQFKDDLEALRELAVQAGELEQWRIALELWQYFVKIKPDYAESYANLSGIYWQLGQYDTALTSANRAIDLNPKLKEAHYNVAVSVMLMGRAVESKEILEKLLLEHDDYLGARFMLAAALSFTGDMQQSIQEFRACQRILSVQAISMAVENLITKLKNSHQEAFGRLLENTVALIN